MGLDENNFDGTSYDDFLGSWDNDYTEDTEDTDELDNTKYTDDINNNIYDDEDLNNVPNTPTNTPEEEVKKESIDEIRKEYEKKIKEPIYYKLNFINIDKCMFELRNEKWEEWVKFLEKNYKKNEIKYFKGMTDFSVIYDKTGLPVITTNFILTIDTFYNLHNKKEENSILVPIFNREDLVNGNVYTNVDTNQFFWYKDNKIGELSIRLKKETFDTLLATELAKYCYSDNGRLTFYKKGYTPKIILEENISFIKDYIANINTRSQLYI